jgi:hypothetical protein
MAGLATRPVFQPLGKLFFAVGKEDRLAEAESRARPDSWAVRARTILKIEKSGKDLIP